MRVLICGLFRVPDGDAGAVRQNTLATMCRNIGHETLIVGQRQSKDMQTQNCEGVVFVSLFESGRSNRNKISMHFRYWKKLKQVFQEYRPDVIIMDDLGPLETTLIMRYCRKERIQLIHDSVEWYSPEQFRHGRLSVKYLKKDLLNRCLINKNCGVIAISQYLFQHFQSKGCHCVRIPIVISENDLCCEKHPQGNKVVFSYAGQPGKKDYLNVMLEAFSQLSSDMLERTQFHIVGCDRRQMIDAGISEDVLNKLQKNLIIHGRVSRNEVLDILKVTDFTILMRSPQQRYAKAGFPTKVVESLSRSTPVICNVTSDLGMYLVDGENALLVEECDATSLKKQLVRAIRMDRADRERMYSLALTSASSHFDLHKYEDALASLIGKDRSY